MPRENEVDLILKEFPPPDRLNGLDKDTLKHLALQIREFMHVDGRDCPGGSCMLEDDEHELRPDWRRVTVDADGDPTVHNRPQVFRVELPPEGTTAKKMGVRPPRKKRTAIKRVAEPAASPPAAPPKIRVKNWDDREYVWKPVVRDPATRNLGQLVVKVDHGEETEYEVEADEVAPPPAPPAPPVPTFAAPPPPPAPPATPGPPPRTMPSLDAARVQQKRVTAPPTPPVVDRVPAPVKAAVTQVRERTQVVLPKHPRYMKKTLELLGAQVSQEDGDGDVTVTYQGRALGKIQMKNYRTPRARQAWQRVLEEIASKAAAGRGLLRRGQDDH